MSTFWNDYNRFLKSDQWKIIRQRLLNAWGNRCFCCRKGYKTLHVHHLNYTNYTNPGKHDVRILCEPCHKHVTMLSRRYRRTKSLDILIMHMAKCTERRK